MNIKYDDLTKLFAIEQAKETSYRSTLRQSLASFLSLCDKADISVDTKTELKYICNYINDIVKYFENVLDVLGAVDTAVFSKMLSTILSGDVAVCMSLMEDFKCG